MSCRPRMTRAASSVVRRAEHRRRTHLLERQLPPRAPTVVGPPRRRHTNDNAPVQLRIRALLAARSIRSTSAIDDAARAARTHLDGVAFEVVVVVLRRDVVTLAVRRPVDDTDAPAPCAFCCETRAATSRAIIEHKNGKPMSNLASRGSGTASSSFSWLRRSTPRDALPTQIRQCHAMRSSATVNAT